MSSVDKRSQLAVNLDRSLQGGQLSPIAHALRSLQTLGEFQEPSVTQASPQKTSHQSDRETDTDDENRRCLLAAARILQGQTKGQSAKRVSSPMEEEPRKKRSRPLHDVTNTSIQEENRNLPIGKQKPPASTRRESLTSSITRLTSSVRKPIKFTRNKNNEKSPRTTTTTAVFRNNPKRRSLDSGLDMMRVSTTGRAVPSPRRSLDNATVTRRTPDTQGRAHSPVLHNQSRSPNPATPQQPVNHHTQSRANSPVVHNQSRSPNPATPRQPVNHDTQSRANSPGVLDQSRSPYRRTPQQRVNNRNQRRQSVNPSPARARQAPVRGQNNGVGQPVQVYQARGLRNENERLFNQLLRLIITHFREIFNL